MPVVRNYLATRYNQQQEKGEKGKPLNVETLLIPVEKKISPLSPIIARKKYIASQTPFAPESEDEVRFGINDSSEDHKFTSYHLDYKYTPPIHKGPCAACGNFIIGSMVTACEKMYCPGCFLCTNCGVEMKPAYYKVHDERPYCRKCHSELFLPPCHACGDYLGEHYVSTGDNRYFHKKCFNCFKCHQHLNPKKYFQKDARLYCEPCYNNLFRPKCAKCFGPISDEPILGSGRPYHKQCLSCFECKKSLNPNNFKERNGNLYCPDCFNNLFSPKCGGCRKPVVGGAPVTLDGKIYHKACFNCNQCNKELSPKNYKKRNEKLYCPGCYHDLFSPKCTACRTPITKAEPLVGGGKPYHGQCFNCSQCKRSLTSKNFLEKGGKLYCPDCYHNLFSPKCTGCKKAITTGNPVNLPGGKCFHKTCFSCNECGQLLNSNNFKERSSKNYCPDCFHRLFSPKCYGCQKPIVEDSVIGSGRQYHKGCFSCSECRRYLNPNNFKEKSGKLYCPDCYHNLFSERCAGCHQAIFEQALYAMGKYWHTNHFSCANCQKQLRESAFYEQDNRSYCESCYLNLFAPKCKKCRRPITNQVYLFALGADWHENCFRCTECNCHLDENSFYDFEGEPYCEEHYHKRICPQCLKMRRAVERYLGQPEGSSSKPDSVATQRSLILPLSRSGSRISMHEELQFRKNQSEFQSSPIPIVKEPSYTDTSSSTISGITFKRPIEQQIQNNSNFNQYSSDGYLNHQQHLQDHSESNGQLVKQSSSSSLQQTKKEWDTLYSPPAELNWKNSTIWDSFPIGYPSEYFKKDQEAFTKSSGALLPHDANLQFESTFKKEISESITRY